MSSRATPLDGAPAELPGGYAYEIVAVCQRLGVAPDDLLAGTGLDLPALKAPATRLSLAQCAALVEQAERLTGNPALAFAVGGNMKLSWHGFLGFALMSAGTLGEAVELAERFSLTRTSAFALGTYVEGGTASLVVEERASLGALRAFAVTALLVGIARIGSEATGRALTGSVELALPEPPYLARLRAGGAVPDDDRVRFDRPAHRLVFEASQLELPILTANPSAFELARAQCDRELAAAHATAGLAGRVRRAIAAQPDGVASLAPVARQLHLSTRTLKRALSAQGTSFSELQGEVRLQRALLLLDDRRLSLTEVAARLGYSDAANFSRAFRRWTGRAPGAARTRTEPAPGA